MRDLWGNSCPYTLLFAQPRTLLQYAVLREFTGFCNHLPADELRTVGMTEGRSSGLSAVHDTPVVAIWTCAGQPVQDWFVPPAPSISVMVQGALPLKVQSWSMSCWPSLSLWHMAESWVAHSWACWEAGPSTDRVQQLVGPQPLPKDWQKWGVSWVSLCLWEQDKHYRPTHTLLLTRTEKLSVVQWMTLLPSSLTLAFAASALHMARGWCWPTGSSRRDPRGQRKGPAPPLSGSERAHLQGRESDLGSPGP